MHQMHYLMHLIHLAYMIATAPLFDVPSVDKSDDSAEL